jgi:hypothetical protein
METAMVFRLLLALERVDLAEEAEQAAAAGVAKSQKAHLLEEAVVEARERTGKSL